MEAHHLLKAISFTPSLVLISPFHHSPSVRTQNVRTEVNVGNHCAHCTEGKAEAQRVDPMSGATGKVKVYNSQFLFSPKLIEKKLILLKLELMLLFFKKIIL